MGNSIDTQEIVAQDNSTAVKNKVNIKVYYETLCPASVTFFMAQLRPVVEKLGSHLDVHLIPYGHARTRKLRGKYLFKCQHGPDECHGNKLHACAVDALQNSTQAVMYNACLMQYSVYRSEASHYDSMVLNWCGYSLNLPVKGIFECMYTERGTHLMKGYGDETFLLRPHYVPHVILDNSTTDQRQVISDLMTSVCRNLHPAPPPCVTF
ncbi:gamma-interferon-inducible lysosomal thiol reductase [Aphomia sociella]